jgi:hypothetical protein
MVGIRARGPGGRGPVPGRRGRVGVWPCGATMGRDGAWHGRGGRGGAAMARGEGVPPGRMPFRRWVSTIAPAGASLDGGMGILCAHSLRADACIELQTISIGG